MRATILTLVFLTVAIPPVLADTEDVCPISQSIYRDANGQGFELVFGPPPVGSIVDATAVINHPQQSLLYQFTVDQISGYGSIWLSEQEPKLPDSNQTFWLAFFDQNLQSATPLFFGEETEAPQYAVISELGSYDYYARRETIGQSSPPLVRDVIWIHDRCQ